MFSELLEYLTQVLLMFLFILRVHQNIINEHHDELIQKLHKHLVHHVHEIGRCVSQTKLHNGVLVQPISGGKYCLGYILLSNL